MTGAEVRHVLLSGRRHFVRRLVAVTAAVALGGLMAVPATAAQAGIAERISLAQRIDGETPVMPGALITERASRRRQRPAVHCRDEEHGA